MKFRHGFLYWKIFRDMFSELKDKFKKNQPKDMWEDYYNRGIIGEESYNLIRKSNSKEDKGCGVRFDINSYGYVNCGEIYHNVISKGDSRIVYCKECRNHDLCEVCKCGHTKKDHDYHNECSIGGEGADNWCNCKSFVSTAI